MLLSRKLIVRTECSLENFSEKYKKHGSLALTKSLCSSWKVLDKEMEKAFSPELLQTHIYVTDTRASLDQYCKLNSAFASVMKT